MCVSYDDQMNMILDPSCNGEITAEQLSARIKTHRTNISIYRTCSLPLWVIDIIIIALSESECDSIKIYGGSTCDNTTDYNANYLLQRIKPLREITFHGESGQLPQALLCYIANTSTLKTLNYSNYANASWSHVTKIADAMRVQKSIDTVTLTMFSDNILIDFIDIAFAGNLKKLTVVIIGTEMRISDRTADALSCNKSLKSLAFIIHTTYIYEYNIRQILGIINTNVSITSLTLKNVAIIEHVDIIADMIPRSLKSLTLIGASFNHVPSCYKLISTLEVINIENYYGLSVQSADSTNNIYNAMLSNTNLIAAPMFEQRDPRITPLLERNRKIQKHIIKGVIVDITMIFHTMCPYLIARIFVACDPAYEYVDIRLVISIIIGVKKSIESIKTSDQPVLE